MFKEFLKYDLLPNNLFFTTEYKTWYSNSLERYFTDTINHHTKFGKWFIDKPRIFFYLAYLVISVLLTLAYMLFSPIKALLVLFSKKKKY